MSCYRHHTVSAREPSGRKFSLFLSIASFHHNLPYPSVTAVPRGILSSLWALNPRSIISFRVSTCDQYAGFSCWHGRAIALVSVCASCDCRFSGSDRGSGLSIPSCCTHPCLISSMNLSTAWLMFPVIRRSFTVSGLRVSVTLTASLRFAPGFRFFKLLGLTFMSLSVFLSLAARVRRLFVKMNLNQQVKDVGLLAFNNFLVTKC